MKLLWHHLKLLSFLFLGISLLSACSNDSSQRRELARDDILAQVGGHYITINDFQKAMNQQSPYFRSQFISLVRKKEFLRDLIKFEVLILEAERRGMQYLWPVKLAERKAMINLLIKRIIAKVSPSLIKVAELKRYYEKHRNLFPKQSFDQARDSILKSLLQQRRRQIYKRYLAQLRKKTKIHINQKLLAQLEQKYKNTTTPKKTHKTTTKPTARKTTTKPTAHKTTTKPTTHPSTKPTR